MNTLSFSTIYPFGLVSCIGACRNLAGIARFGVFCRLALDGKGPLRTPSTQPVSLPFDPLQARGDAALEQRPVEAEREHEVAAIDHLVGLLGGARHAADHNPALEDAGLGARYQRLHLGIIDLAALV